MPVKSKKQLETDCQHLQEDCECLIDLLDDVLAECDESGCLHSAAVIERVDEWLEPPEDEDDVIEVVPES